MLALGAPRDIRRIMRRRRQTFVLAVVCGLAGLAAHPSVASGQRVWNDAPSRALVERATARRARQLADSGLVDYSATAHGYLTFMAQVGENFPLSPRVVKADELALEVYWRAPNYSKQWIVGRRDTLLFPTDIQYHRDHLGIVQNNFPDIIRLGDGDEVRDVPHPLSAPGLTAYDFAISDSLRFEIPGRTIDVYEVKLRPRNDRAPAAVGALYVAKDDAQVVRMAFSFTRSALKDRQLEDVSIVLENSLTEGRFWLPRRQEIEIRRSGTWMDFPARGIIRGRWEIRDYRVNQGETATAAPGPEIVLAPAQRRAAHKWPETSILEALPESEQVASREEVERVQEEARRLVRAQALARAQGTLPSARSVSDLARVNRAEGLSLGLGLRRRVGAGFDAGVQGRYGLADHEPKAVLSFGWERADGVAARLRVFREYRDAGDEPESSRLRNSIAAQEFGSDYTQPYDTRGVGATVQLGTHGGLRWQIDGAYEWQEDVAVAARPARGRYEPTLAAARVAGPRMALSFERPAAPTSWGGMLRLRGEVRGGSLHAWRDGTGRSIPDPGLFYRIRLAAEGERSFGRSRLVVRLAGGGGDAEGGLPPQELLFAGGPTTGPGYAFHQFQAGLLSTQRVEWRLPIPFVGIPLGRWGRVPAQAQLTPFAHGVWTSRVMGGDSRPGWHPSLGVGVLTFFDLVRIDVARGTRDGRWTFGIDVTRDFWPIL